MVECVLRRVRPFHPILVHIAYEGIPPLFPPPPTGLQQDGFWETIIGGPFKQRSRKALELLHLLIRACMMRHSKGQVRAQMCLRVMSRIRTSTHIHADRHNCPSDQVSDVAPHARIKIRHSNPHPPTYTELPGRSPAPLAPRPHHRVGACGPPLGLREVRVQLLGDSGGQGVCAAGRAGG
jgi:hypothetical protein